MATTADDARHSVLSKARPLSQRSLESFAEEAGAAALLRSEFGTYTVQEVETRRALTRMPPPYDQWSLNPYTGCSHACSYCYVPDVAHVQRERWGSYVIVRRNLPTVLERELKRVKPDTVFMSSATDPYQPAEARHEITRRCLEVLRRADWPLRVLTRSPLVTRDLDLLSGFGDLRVGLSVPTMDDGLRRVLEPAAPPVHGRLAALRRLHDAGIDTFANYAPACPPTGDATPATIAKAFSEARVGVVYAGSFRYLPGVGPVLEARLAGTPYAPVLPWIRDPFAQASFLTLLSEAMEAAGVPFRAMGRGRPGDRVAPPRL